MLGRAQGLSDLLLSESGLFIALLTSVEDRSQVGSSSPKWSSFVGAGPLADRPRKWYLS